MAETIKYFLTRNCQPVTTATGGLIYYTKNGYMKEHPETKEIQEDKRLYLMSVDSTGDLQEYLNYYSIIVSLINNRLLGSDAKGKFAGHLDMGYVPVLMPPSYLRDYVNKIFEQKIRNTGVRILSTPTMRLDGSKESTFERDLWVSRIDMGEYLNITPDKVKPLDFLSEVIRRV